MNSTAVTRRLVRLLAALALTGTAAFALGMALDAFALPLFSLTTAALIVLVLAGDYAHRPRYDRATLAPVVTFPTRERMALAA